MIKSIFYARFHAEQGPKVLHEVPEGSITPSSSHSALRQPLFDYTSVLDCIIPRQEFCDRLVTVCVSRYRVIGYPVCISDYDGKYFRNEFIFNFALVIDEDVDDWASYASVIRKLGRLLRALEEQGGFLSKDESPSSTSRDKNFHSTNTKSYAPLNANGRAMEKTASSSVANDKLYALCEMILEDLNNYRECMIPIDDSNTINLKLFPMHPPPAPVHAWHVPLLTINLSSFSSQNLSSDLTLQRVLPFLDGINSVSHISKLADTDQGLTRKAIQHLVYYSCVLLLDVFQFNAIYAPTAEIRTFVVSRTLQEECARYVAVPRIHRPVATAVEDVAAGSFSLPTYDHRPQATHEIYPETLVRLYTSLKQGVTLRAWCLDHVDLLAGIDIRRLITFGVIKGFLYRVHKYAIATSSGHQSPANVGTPAARTPGSVRLKGGKVEEDYVAAGVAAVDARQGPELPLEKYLDGIHSFDEICTELSMNERDVLAKMKGFGDVQIIQR